MRFHFILLLCFISCSDVEIIETKTDCNQISFAEKIFTKSIENIDEHSLDNLCLLETRNLFTCDKPDQQQACCDLKINLCCYNELGYIFCRWL